MEKTKFDNSLLDIMLEEEAWKNISRAGNLSESLLEKYRSELDWEAVTTNSSIHWTPSMLERFKRQIDWQQLSSYAEAELLVPEVVERFKDYWNWDALSENSNLPLETVERFPDRVNWSHIINRYSNENDRFTRAFLEKWADRIPAEKFKDSTLFYDLVLEKEKELIRRMFAED